MHTYPFFVVVTVLMVLTGCWTLHQPKRDSGIVRKIGACNPTPCIDLSLDGLPELPEALDSDVASIINAEIAAVLYMPVDAETSQPASSAVLRELEAKMKEYEAFGDSAIEWNLKRSVRVDPVGRHFISAVVVSDGYLGGAHGFHEVAMLMFSTEDGNRLALNDILDDSKRVAFQRVVEAEFRRARNIPVSQRFDDAGFFVPPGGELPLSKNFLLTPNGLELYYNNYEIGPYVLGSTQLSIPIDVVKSLVKEDITARWIKQPAQQM